MTFSRTLGENYWYVFCFVTAAIVVVYSHSDYNVLINLKLQHPSNPLSVVS